MNINETKTTRANKTTTTAVVGLVALALGLVIGAAAENGAGLHSGKRQANPATNDISSAAPASPQRGVQSAWDPFQEIRAMQRQMDRSFDQMFDQFRTDPEFNVFEENPGYSLSLDVRDLKDHYEVRAYLPDAKASDVHVSLTNGQTLNVQVNGNQNLTSGQNNAGPGVAEWSQYEQEVQLPTPVKADQMKIKHEGHELVITIPKTT